MAEEKNTGHGPARWGRGMLLGGWLLGLLLLVFFFNGLLEHQRNPNRSPSTAVTGSGTREVVLQRNKNGHYLASGEINGLPVEFLLDTGATDVSIPEAIARLLGLEQGPPLVYGTANGTITAYLTTLSSLSLGDIVVHRVRASINPHMGDETILLGMSFLKHLEFTQRGDTLIIRQYPQQ